MRHEETLTEEAARMIEKWREVRRLTRQEALMIIEGLFLGFDRNVLEDLMRGGRVMNHQGVPRKKETPALGWGSFLRSGGALGSQERTLTTLGNRLVTR